VAGNIFDINMNRLTLSDGWGLIRKVNELLQHEDTPVFVVGGWVRDGLLGKPSRDIDFVVAGDGMEAARKIAQATGGRFVTLDNINRVGRVVLVDNNKVENRILDFASMIGEAIEVDLSRRDFTIDAIAIYPMAKREEGIGIIDPYQGRDDLEKRIIRATAKTVFSDDPIRLLRAVRLAAQLNFKIDDITEKTIRQDAGLINRSAGERIREELVLLLSIPGSGRFLSYLDKLGLLIALIPELEVSRESEQPKEHYWKVLQHSLETAKAFDFILRENNWEFADFSFDKSVERSVDSQVLQKVLWTEENSSYFKAEAGYQSTRETIFRLAAVLHDIGKPQTRTVEVGGKIRFLGHAQIGAEMTQTILERLRFSTREIRLASAAVKYHMRPTQMGWPELPSKKAVYRYFRDTGEAAMGVLYLSLADHLATRGPTLDMDNWEIHARISNHILEQKQELTIPKQFLVDGYDIMNRFNLHPGKLVGQLLDNAREAQASGQITTKDEALTLLKDIIDRSSISGEEEGGD
jgi:poly(A) polymerase